MPGIDDEPRTSCRSTIAVLTVSDTRTLEDDRSGDTLAERLTKAGHTLGDRAIVPDKIEMIRRKVKAWVANPAIDVVITTGGTGFTGRDVTPEAIEPLFDKRMDGFSAVFHRISLDTVGTSTIQSRATAGLAGTTFIFVLPGSPGACRDAWDGILAAQLDYRHRPCNFVEIMPRLDEHLKRGKPAPLKAGSRSMAAARRTGAAPLCLAEHDVPAQQIPRPDGVGSPGSCESRPAKLLAGPDAAATGRARADCRSGPRTGRAPGSSPPAADRRRRGREAIRGGRCGAFAQSRPAPRRASRPPPPPPARRSSSASRQDDGVGHEAVRDRRNEGAEGDGEGFGTVRDADENGDHAGQHNVFAERSRHKDVLIMFHFCSLFMKRSHSVILPRHRKCPSAPEKPAATPGAFQPALSRAEAAERPVGAWSIRPTRVDPDRRRGRGAVANPTGRFEPAQRETFEDGWAFEEELAPLDTEVIIEKPRTIIARNDSPDIGFDRSINPYRGCEHGCSYCFARPSHAFQGLSSGLDFETKIFAKPSAPRASGEGAAGQGLRAQDHRHGLEHRPLPAGRAALPHHPRRSSRCSTGRTTRSGSSRNRRS